jgi:hypothetical protein
MAKKNYRNVSDLGFKGKYSKNLNLSVLSGTQNKKMHDCIDTDSTPTLKYLGSIFTKSGKYK